MQKHVHSFGAKEVKELLSDSPFIVQVGCRKPDTVLAMLEAMPACHVVCFDAEHPRPIAPFSDPPRLNWLPVSIAAKVSGNGKEKQVRPLDYYWDEFRIPVDMILADDYDDVPGLILGGQRTFGNTRYLAFRPGCRALTPFLPGFDLAATYCGALVYKNTEL